MMMMSSVYGDESLPCMYTTSNYVYLSGKTCYNLIILMTYYLMIDVLIDRKEERRSY